MTEPVAIAVVVAVTIIGTLAYSFILRQMNK